MVAVDLLFIAVLISHSISHANADCITFWASVNFLQVSMILFNVVRVYVFLCVFPTSHLTYFHGIWSEQDQQKIGNVDERPGVGK